jgi:hypothetical protein
MGNKPFVYISAVIVLGLLVVLIISYKGTGRATPTIQTTSTAIVTPSSTQVSPATGPLAQFPFSCAQSSTTAYEDQVMGMAFCYPSNLAVATGTITWPEIFVPVAGPYKDPPQQPVLNFRIIHVLLPAETGHLS